MLLSEYVKIPESQVEVHKTSEAAALIFGVPFLLYVAATTHNELTRVGALVFAGATLVVDGGLLLKWARK